MGMNARGVDFESLRLVTRILRDFVTETLEACFIYF